MVEEGCSRGRGACAGAFEAPSRGRAALLSIAGIYMVRNKGRRRGELEHYKRAQNRKLLAKFESSAEQIAHCGMAKSVAASRQFLLQHA